MKPKFSWKVILVCLFLIGVIITGCTMTYVNYQKEQELGEQEVPSLEENEKEIIEFVKGNTCLLGTLFKTYSPYDVFLDFQDVSTRLAFIRDYFFIKNFNEELYRSQDDTGMQPMLDTYLEENYIKEKSKEFFDVELTASDLSSVNKIDEAFYNTEMMPDGGLPMFYPVLNKIEYDETTNTTTIYIIDYRSISENLKNYANTTEISDEELQNLGLLDKTNLLIIEVKEENGESYLTKSEFIYREDLNSLEYQDVGFTNDGTNFMESLKNKESLIEFLKKNGSLLASVFKTYYKETHTLDFQDLNTRLAFIRDFVVITKEDESKIQYVERENQPSSDVFVQKGYLEEKSKTFFNQEINEEDFASLEKIGNVYYDTGMAADGGCPTYYPVLNKIEYDEENDLYSLYLIDYRSFSNDMASYENTYKITDEELEEKGLLNQIDILQIDYQIKEGKKILLHSNFINKQELETLGK